MGMMEYIPIAAMALVSGAIAAVIWTTVYLNSRRNGLILLAVFVFLGINQMINVYPFSNAAGTMLLVIYSALGLLSVHRIKTRKHKETSGDSC
ncbi:hypothetical protein AV656_13300 [Bhargavaea cecembensis]|uniref:Uncharacterized protein n=1 Tax=Bhargavaea cecembensis TaxID=394098 RepID=A0A165GST2_9BACL|nr:hypothetical protein [Bhargavaea cecembensis]KZE37529.1 hypothetical protein AV656_13300 [Bhargavaea cecembensis]